MKELNYKEIYYTSSEKGIFTENAGFGVRTCSKEIDSIDVNLIIDSCVTGYAVYNDRILDKEKIANNPKIVYDYPPTYQYRKVVLSDGTTHYVFGRTIYLGADYGFFKGINAYDRTGTNYFTHLLVFDEQPPCSLIRELLISKKYIPHDYTCSPTNLELVNLLTGNPVFLDTNRIELGIFEDINIKTPIIPLFIQGLVQILKNRQTNIDNQSLYKMIVKCPSNMVEECLCVLSYMPDDYLLNIQYVSNYMQGYGIPDGYDIAFVNEFNEVELYEDNYVTINLFDSTTKNIKTDIFIEKITLLCKQGDYKTVFQLIAYYLKLKDVSDQDLPLYYDLFIIIESERETHLLDLSEYTINKIPTIPLNPEQKAQFWHKVNLAINESLTSVKGQELLMAIEKTGKLNRLCPNCIILQDYCVSYVTNILFNGRGNFGKIVTNDNVDTLIWIINKKLIPSESLFFASLTETTDLIVWEKCLRFYYKEDFYDHPEIITAILNSNLTFEDKNGLILKLYPLTLSADFLFDYLKNNVDCFNDTKDVIVSLLQYYGIERVEDFIWLTHLNPDLLEIITPMIKILFEKEIDSYPQRGINSFFDLVSNVGSEQIDKLHLWPLLELATDKQLDQSIANIEAFLEKIKTLNIPDNYGNINNLKCLVAKKTPEKVDKQFFYAVFINYHNDEEYYKKIIDKWINTGISKLDLTTFLSDQNDNLSDDDISLIINSIWQSQQISYPRKEELILSIIDIRNWGKNKIELFCNRCDNHQLKAFLLKSNGLINKVIRKISKLWKDNITLLLLLVTFISLVGCREPKQWINPFKYQYYDCIQNSFVKEFRTYIYNSKRKLVEISKCEFNKYGDLINQTTIIGTDTIRTIYQYNEKGKLIDIIPTRLIDNRIIYDPMGQLNQIQLFKKDDNYKEQLIGSISFEYDSVGRLLTQQNLEEAIGYLSNSHSDELWKRETTTINYENGLISWIAHKLDNDIEDTHLLNNYIFGNDGLIKNEITEDPITEKSLNKYDLTYTKDKHGNWIECTVKSQGKTTEIRKREFVYYSLDEITTLDSITKPRLEVVSNNIASSLSPISSYLSNFKNRIDQQLYNFEGGPVLIAIILILTISGIIVIFVRMIKKPVFERKIYGNGMKRMWMYDSSRYLNVLLFFLLALGCFLGAIFVLALIGGIAWLLAWIIKIFFIIIIWAGIIMTIIGALGALGESEIAGFLIPGILILIFKGRLEEWGEEIVDWSFNFLNRINLIGSGFNLIVNLWDIILTIFITPIIIFLLVALLIIIFNTTLNVMEWIITKIYSIRRPCPSCGCTKKPDYIIGGRVHPAKLHPGVYGIFSQVSPNTGQKIPTMLLNGKGKLTRKCPHCGTIINSDTKKTVGTDLHIGLVGHRSSGKSYLLYSGLSSLLKKYPDIMSQIDSDLDTNINSKKQRIDAWQGIQTNVSNRYRAIQLMVQSKLRPVPYHLFFYDVAGEKYNASSASFKTAMDFYKNVQSIVFIIDPNMIDYTGIPANEKIKNWANRPGINNGETYRIDNTFSVLKDILESVGRKSTKIDFCFVCTKVDTGYFEEIGKNRNKLTEKEIEHFIRIDLGLGNLVNSAIASFNNIHFFATSVNNNNDSALKLFEFLMKQLDVNI